MDSPQADPKTLQLEKALEALLQEDVNITARAVTRKIPEVFRAASSITRNPERLAAVQRFAKKQSELRSLMKTAGRKSRGAMAADLAALEQQNKLLERQRDLLIASHRALIRAVGERGVEAWRRFFKDYEDAMRELEEMRAVPSSEHVVELHSINETPGSD
jgi:hypothetical protein